jgi:peroxiredoxin Q/BCP
LGYLSEANLTNEITLNKKIPNFTAIMTGEKPFSVSDYIGKNIILFFYPKDNTPGCTIENIAFRDDYKKFQKANAVIFGISRDSLRSHENFKTKLDLPYELISDPNEILCDTFKVMKIKNMYGKQVRGIERSTFLIDTKGKLIQEWRGIKVANHVEEVLQTVQALT